MCIMGSGSGAFVGITVDPVNMHILPNGSGITTCCRSGFCQGESRVRR